MFEDVVADDFLGLRAAGAALEVEIEGDAERADPTCPIA